MALKYRQLMVGPRAFKMPVRPAAEGRGKWLAGLANTHNWTRGAEIGVFRGENFFYLLDHCPQLSMVGVDAWRKRPECTECCFGAAFSNVDMKACLQDVRNRSLDYGDRASIYHMESIEASDYFTHGYFDFVFIDASHDTQSVLADIEAWLPKVRPGGYLAGHDHIHPGVFPAVTQALPGARHVITDNCWFWQC